ncbi:MAG: HAMP domain-containing sensor histidine kinase [Candidatus Moranbacteria bacterium]|nr:HAMP domain-containing sensor histidine kinase [Candidatus Moranbacteria bacterium]
MAWVTGSKNKLFFWAQLKLTFFYSMIIIAILVVSSLGLYVSLKKNIKETYNDKIKDHILRQEAIQVTNDRIVNDLILGNAVLIVFSGGLSFFLASKNLRPIKKVLEKQKRFTADASHDLRTPLAIMKTDCELSLKKKGISKDFKDLAQSNLEEIDRMSAMVDQLLFLSRNNGILNQQMEPIHLGKVMDEIVLSCGSLAQNKNISLTVGEIASGSINGNRLNLEKMFLNIMKNAIDYTPDGGKIEVSAKKNKDKIEVSIKDTGIGIDPEDLPHVTEAFYKADKVRGQENGGSGLGLSIVNEIVRNHGGTLHIESKPNQGTSVSLTFPLTG